MDKILPDTAVMAPSPGSACTGCAITPQASVEPMSAQDARTFRIPTMDCPTEEAQIRRALGTVAGVEALHFRLAARTLSFFAHDAVVPQALQAIRQAGFEPVALNGGRQALVARSFEPARIGKRRHGQILALARRIQLKLQVVDAGTQFR